MTAIQKRPFKVIEIPLSKFTDEAVPHHKILFEQHKNTVQRLISNKKIQELNKEIKDKKRNIRQLKDLLYELDTLRAQVEDTDLTKFDDRTFSVRKIIGGLIKDYQAIQKQASELSESQNHVNENIENEDPFKGAGQIQIQGSLSELKLEEHENRLMRVQNLEDDVQDLHGIYVDLNKMVIEQREPVDSIEENIEDTKENVDQGLKQLVKASKFKTAAYPVTGALMGTLVGGPVGLVAGFKVGGMAAIGCGLAGYASGKFFKKCNEDEIITTENEMNAKKDEEDQTAESPGCQKKEK